MGVGWEKRRMFTYKVLDIREYDAAAVEALVNEVAAEGYRLVGVPAECASGLLLFFEKSVPAAV
jgi:hypothetical protein